VAFLIVVAPDHPPKRTEAPSGVGFVGISDDIDGKNLGRSSQEPRPPEQVIPEIMRRPARQGIGAARQS